MRAFWFAVAGIGMILGAVLPWLSVYMLISGSSGTFVFATEFASFNTQTWHTLFGSSASLVAQFAGTVGRIPIVCGMGMLVAAVLWVFVPERCLIWVRRLAMSLAIVAMLDCLLVIAAVSQNDAKYAHHVSTSIGCYFTLVASVAALIAALIGSPRRVPAQSQRRRHAATRSPMSNSDATAIR